MKKLIIHASILALLAAVFAPAAQEQPNANPPAATPQAAPPAAVAPAENATEPAPGGTENGLRFNFRGVPLETVLEYMSKAAGFIIIPEARLEGRVDVWSHQPLSKDEAYDLLNTVLHKNGYAALRNGRTLTIVTQEEAKKREIPVKILSATNAPASIPKNDEMVTQIIPVRYANAMQMVRDLQPLLPNYATLTANESGNALVLTDTQASIRRLAEIVRALDTSISSISAIRVFPMRYADAKEVSDIIKALFEPPSTSSQRGGGPSREQVQQFFQSRFGGGGPGGDGGGGGGRGGFGGFGGGQTGTGVSEARRAASRVVAEADERTNSLVVSAPDEYMPTIENLILQIDTEVDDITELRVFFLKNSNPTEMADMLTQLFPDESQSEGNRGGFRFGSPFGSPFGGRGRGGGNQEETSDRAKRMGRVLAVPEERTSSIVVSAASNLMPQIAQMIEQIDADPARKQKVHIFPLANADPTQTEEILRNMFEGQNTRNMRGNTGLGNNNNNNPLNNRNSFNQGGGGGGFGGGFGGGGGGGTGQQRR